MTAAPQPLGYVVVDSRTGSVVARCKTLNAARRSADRRDCQYGAYRYRARAAMPSEAQGFRSAP